MLISMGRLDKALKIGDGVTEAILDALGYQALLEVAVPNSFKNIQEEVRNRFQIENARPEAVS